jgi:hypothetical protein
VRDKVITCKQQDGKLSQHTTLLPALVMHSRSENFTLMKGINQVTLPGTLTLPTPENSNTYSAAMEQQYLLVDGVFMKMVMH